MPTIIVILILWVNEKETSEAENLTRILIDLRAPTGLILNSMGMTSSLTNLQQLFLLPVSRLLFPVHGAAFNDHYSFIVSYEMGKDLGLDMHTDGPSDVTWNICLGEQVWYALR